MKKMFLFFVTAVFIFAGCATSPQPQAPPAQKTVKKEAPAVIDFGNYWKGTVRLEEEKGSSDLGTKAVARFYSEWTRGEGAGNVYPKSFTEPATGNTVKMDFKWDNGGVIEGGTYDVVVDVDGMPGKGTIKNLQLKKGIEYNVYISFKAAKIDIPMKTDGDDIFVYPAGTKKKYESLGRLNNIPKDLLINHINSYNENNAIWWLIPAGIPLDIFRTYSNGKSEWITNFTAVPESFVKHLP